MGESPVPYWVAILAPPVCTAVVMMVGYGIVRALCWLWEWTKR